MYLKFDEGTGTTTNDSIRNSAQTITSANWTTGKITNALTYYTSASRVVLDRTFYTNNTGTINCWVRPTGTTGTRSVFGIGGTTSNQPIFNFRLDSPDNNLTFVFRTLAGSIAIFYAKTPIPINTFTMVTLASDGSKDYIYVNATRKTITMGAGSNTGQWANDIGTSSISASIGNIMVLGSYSGNMIGKIDECAYYDKNLSQTNITSLYNSGTGKQYPFTSYTPPSTNYTIKAKSSYNNSAINSFSITLTNKTTTKYYNCVNNCSKIATGDTRKYNVTCRNVTNYFNRTYLNYNFSASGNLECLMNRKGAYIQLYTKDNNMTEKMRITSTGFVGIGTTSPQYMLDISGTTNGSVLALRDSNGICLHNPESGSEIVTCTSDESLKTNITNSTESSIETISKYRVKNYIIKSTGTIAKGVIAQELQQVMPDQVHNIDGILMVDMPNIWNIVKAIQELTNYITELNNKVNQLTEENNQLKQYVSDMKDELCYLDTEYCYNQEISRGMIDYVVTYKKSNSTNTTQ